MQTKLERWLKQTQPAHSLSRTWQLGGGVSSSMLGFETRNSDGMKAQFVLRQPSDWTLQHVPHAVRHESALLKELARLDIAAPRVSFVDEKSTHFGRPSLVLQYLVGKPELAPAQLKPYLKQFAHHLSALHRSLPEGAVRRSLPSAQVTFQEALLPKARGPGSAAQIECIQQALGRHSQLQPNNESVLLHGDFWPGNTLWHEGEFVATIDWEEAKYGDPLLDLSISRLDLYFALGRNAMLEFTAQYLAQSTIDAAQLPLWDLVTALRPIGNFEKWAAAYPALGRPDITPASMVAAQLRFVEDALLGAAALEEPGTPA